MAGRTDMVETIDEERVKEARKTYEKAGSVDVEHLNPSEVVQVINPTNPFVKAVGDLWSTVSELVSNKQEEKIEIPSK